MTKHNKTTGDNLHKHDHCGCHGSENNEHEHEHNCQCEEHDCNCNDNDCECNDCDCNENAPNGSKEEEYLLLAKRVQAEFDNFRKRSAGEYAKARHDGMVSAIETVLPALDSISKATEMITDEQSLNGFKLVQKNLLEALQKLGVEQMDTLNKPFDPNFHNALAIVPTANYEDGVVMQEAKAGYTMHGKVIRYAQVIVAKNEPTQA